MSVAFEKFDLTGKTALVTGGGTGLGYYMSRGLARSGATIMIAARREGVLKDAAQKLSDESDGASVLYHTVDLANRSSVSELADHAIDTMGGVDIFIANAAVDNWQPLESVTDEAMDEVWQVNVAANVALIRSFLPGMRAKKFGRILFSSSGTSVTADAEAGMGIYSSSKGALNTLTRTAAAEFGHDGITVNSLILGVFLTEMFQEIAHGLDVQHGQGAGQGFIDLFASMTSLGRFGECDEVEGLVQLLASNAGSYITGTNLAIDGGLTVTLRPHAVATPSA